MAANPGLWQVDIVHVKTECFFEYIKLIPSGIELMKKAGAQPINQYITEAGGAPEVVFISKFGKGKANKWCYPLWTVHQGLCSNCAPQP